MGFCETFILAGAYLFWEYIALGVLAGILIGYLIGRKTTSSVQPKKSEEQHGK